MADDMRSGPGGTGATVYIGPKPTMTYVFQVVAQVHSGASPVVIKARGNAIGKAVDVAEVVAKRFLEGAVTVGPITIDTEHLVNREGREANVSAIAIPITPRPGATIPAPGSRSARPSAGPDVA
jgi:archaea-specific DNA-binding protein